MSSIPGRARGRALAALSVLLLAGAACGDAGEAATEPTLGGAVRVPNLEVGDTVLPDVSNGGAPMPMRAPDGELLLVYFGYTSCPDVCPTTMSDLRVAIEALPSEQAERVAVAMATVDPERDTDEMLARYLDSFFDRSHPLRTDDPEALAAVADAFTVQWQIEEHEPGEPYAVAHTATTFVVDDTGTVAVEWPFGFEPAAMTADLTTLLEQETP